MIAKLRSALLVGFAIAIATCSISIMYIFMRGDAGGGDMQVLLQIQAAAIPAALMTFFIELFNGARANGNPLKAIWRATPAWVVLALLLFNFLVLIGELALFLRAHLTDRQVHWFEHTPLLCVVTCSLAICALYARAYPAENVGSPTVKRW